MSDVMTSTQPSTSAPEAPAAELHEQPARAEAEAAGRSEPARAPVATQLDEQRARFERARAAGGGSPAQPRAPRALEAQPSARGAEEWEEQPEPSPARRAPAQRARTRAEAAPRARPPRAHRTLAEKLERAQMPDDVASILDYAAEAGLLNPRVARAAGAAVRAAGSIPSTARVVTPADAPPAQPLPADAPPTEDAAPAEPPPPPPPAEFMGIPVRQLEPFKKPGAVAARAIVQASRGTILDLTDSNPLTMYRGTTAQCEVTADPTEDLASLISGFMAEKWGGDAGPKKPSDMLKAWAPTIALAVWQRAGSRIAASAGRTAARVLGAGGRALRGALRRKP
jgi:hypothetical protein